MKYEVTQIWHLVIVSIERILAGIVICGVLVYAVTSIRELFLMDWTQNESFYQFIYRILLLIIGLELARMLITHSITAVLELLSFVIARKMLKPDLTSLDIILSVMAFVALAITRHYCMKDTNDSMVYDTLNTR